MEPPLLLRILLPLASLSWLLLLLLARGSAGRCRQILVSPLLLACFVFVLFCSTDADCPPGLDWFGLCSDWSSRRNRCRRGRVEQAACCCCSSHSWVSEWLVTIAFLFVLLVLRRNNMLSISSSLAIHNFIWTTSRHGIERVCMFTC